MSLDPAVTETHTALVFFVGDRAYKMKKPVSLGFLDFSTRSQRADACRREVELNRRLAPDVYLGVATVLDGDDQPCEHLVVMRRLPSGRRLTACIERGEDVTDALWRVARQVAALHGRSDPAGAPDGVGTVDDVLAHWEDDFATLRRFGGTVFDDNDLAGVRDLVRRYLAGRGRLFEERRRRGRIRDGHGDLQADDIFVLDDGPRVLDCLEFDDRLRWGDVLDDVAFLAMDLERVGRRDLAARFLAWHRELTDDNWPPSLADHAVARRAHIRAKVMAIRCSQGDDGAAADARRFMDLCRAHLCHGRTRLVLTGGLPGTGKSTLAARLAGAHPFVVLRSDEVRESRPDRYAPACVDATYDELLRRAEELLGLGESVIVDATWSSAARRARAREVGARTASDVVELRCEVAADVARARIRRRLATGGDASEATPEVADAMAASFDPWPGAHIVETTTPVDVAPLLEW